MCVCGCAYVRVCMCLSACVHVYMCDVYMCVHYPLLKG